MQAYDRQNSQIDPKYQILDPKIVVGNLYKQNNDGVKIFLSVFRKKSCRFSDIITFPFYFIYNNEGNSFTETIIQYLLNALVFE